MGTDGARLGNLFRAAVVYMGRPWSGEATGDNAGLPDLLLNGRKRVYFASCLTNRPTKLVMHLSGYETPSDNQRFARRCRGPLIRTT